MAAESKAMVHAWFPEGDIPASKNVWGVPAPGPS